MLAAIATDMGKFDGDIERERIAFICPGNREVRNFRKAPDEPRRD
jgi:hypothetical protein